MSFYSSVLYHFTAPFFIIWHSVFNILQLRFCHLTAPFFIILELNFSHFTASFASVAEIQVFIQAVKIKQIWRFHDGFLVPDVFLIGMSNSSEEIHLRAISTDNFKSHDAPDGNRYCYLCKYYLQFKKIVHIWTRMENKNKRDSKNIISCSSLVAVCIYQMLLVPWDDLVLWILLGRRKHLQQLYIFLISYIRKR